MNEETQYHQRVNNLLALGGLSGCYSQPLVSLGVDSSLHLALGPLKRAVVWVCHISC